ncbi:hypothetical protein N568_0102990 [Lactococcus garvieae TRF1]|uniref:10 kDa chaperonin n=1 Tax=Lactococcus garvieae TRF1 TaxID=1380772 RepID=V8AQN3_9LACT|nr:hypothetical protein N568_0102990 [Lactococcus garvieae TRF1]
MLKPLADRVVLRIKEEEEKSLGGIVLASAAQEKPQVAEVVAVGQVKQLLTVQLLHQQYKLVMQFSLKSLLVQM